jgi:hypothetical protein
LKDEDNMKGFLLVIKAMVMASCLCLASLTQVSLAEKSVKEQPPVWTEHFNLQDCKFSTVGRNEYFILEPGYQLFLERIERDDTVKLVITVLYETETVNGVETRVVEEKESLNGELVEISRNFFAFCRNNQSIFYFGEDVEIYKAGKVVSHAGSWRAGLKGARPGLMMPGTILLGARFYQEIAPKVALDRAEIISDSESLQTPAGIFENCLKVEETTPLEPDAREYKIYAPGIGLIKDGNLVLTKCGFVKAEY